MKGRGINVGISAGNHGTMIKWLDVKWNAKAVSDNKSVSVMSDDDRFELVIMKTRITNRRLAGRYLVIMFDLVNGFVQTNLASGEVLSDMVGEELYESVIKRFK